jgi:hypothetical protein
MMKVQDFAEHPRKKELPNFLNMVKRFYNLGEGVDSYIKLNNNQQAKFKELKEEYLNDTKENWRRHIAAIMRWKDP